MFFVSRSTLCSSSRGNTVALTLMVTCNIYLVTCKLHSNWVKVHFIHQPSDFVTDHDPPPCPPPQKKKRSSHSIVHNKRGRKKNLPQISPVVSAPGTFPAPVCFFFLFFSSFFYNNFTFFKSETFFFNLAFTSAPKEWVAILYIYISYVNKNVFKMHVCLISKSHRLTAEEREEFLARYFRRTGSPPLEPGGKEIVCVCWGGGLQAKALAIKMPGGGGGGGGGGGQYNWEKQKMKCRQAVWVRSRCYESPALPC